MRRSELEDLAGRFQQERVPIDVSVRIGRPSVELIRAVIADDYDLVIKTVKGRTDGRQSLFGTKAMRLLRKCPCPVWLVGATPLRRLVHA
jgi:universal stress protein E